MRAPAPSREDAARDLAEAYAAALEDYLDGGGEEALRRGYEIGRRAIAQAVGVLGMATTHHEALAAMLLRRNGGRSLERDLRRAEEFAVESLSPFEMAHRGFREGISALRRLNETLEKEIQRIAHQVHDEAGQLLVAAQLAVSEVEGGAGPAVRKRLRNVRGILDRTEQELRRLSHDLRPTVLDDLGLLPALRLLAGCASRKGSLSVRVEGALGERPAREIEVAVYRVVQEALANVARHARARRVTIRISRDATGSMRCRVKDDGRGFAAAAVLGRGEPGGLGLVAMRERLHAVGGGLDIRSAPGRGTEIVAIVPMEA